MEILLKSFISGVAIGIVLFVTKYLGPKIGGILTMIPLMFTLAFVFATYSKAQNYVNKFVLGSLAGTILFVFFLLALYFLNSKIDKYWLNLFLAYLIWIIGALGWLFFQK